MPLVVGYDHHPASRAAVIFAGELAGALNVPVHVVHVVDMSDAAISADAAKSDDAESALGADRQHVGEALDAVHVQWTYRLANGDPAKALLKAADECAAAMIVVGRPQHGIAPTFGHLVTGTVARNLLRHSTRPVTLVPEFGSTP